VLFRAFLDKISNGWFCLFIINIVSVVFSTIISSIKKYHVLISKDVHTFFFFQWLVWSGTIIFIVDLKLLFLMQRWIM
jgi:hypothetical protein